MIHEVFHKKDLNPELWQGRELKPEVHQKLLNIANKALQDADIDEEPVDILLLGSNASYSYSDFSDIDLHIVVNMSKLSSDEELVRKYLQGVKWKFNTSHNIKIKSHDVEIYFEDINDETKSDGVYSIKHGKWIVKPFKRDPKKIEWGTVKHDIKKIRSQIDQAIEKGGVDDCDNLMDQIRSRRREAIAELGPHTEYNYVFKILRAQGDIGRLKQHCTSLEDKEMSEENEDRVTQDPLGTFKDYHDSQPRQDRGASGDRRLARRGADGAKGVNLIPQKYKEHDMSPRLTMLQKNQNGRIVLNQAEINHIQNTYGIQNMSERGRKLGKTGITVYWYPAGRAWVAEYTG